MSTRDDLVTAATTLLDEGGPERVTLREVGRLAGVSHNAPYKHFTDKQALLEEVAAREFDRLGQGMTTPAGSKTRAVEVLRAALLDYVRWAQQYPRRFELSLGRSMVASEELQRRAGATWQRLIDLTALAQAAGSLPAGDPERLAALARSLAHGAAELSIVGHLSRDGKGHANAEDMVNDLFELLPAGVSDPVR